MFTYCKDLLITFGGHKQAGGLSLKAENYDAFISKVEEYLKGIDRVKKDLSYDYDISNINVDDVFIDQLRSFEPFGLGNKEPVFKITKNKLSYLSFIKSQHLNTSSNNLKFTKFGAVEQYNIISQNLDKDILFKKIENLLRSKCSDYEDLDKWVDLIKQVIYNPCEKNCEKRGWLWLWNILPPAKSLFNTNGKGIPIGNLTSQIFANFYLTDLDKTLSSKVQGYGRYVDDIILLDKDKYKLLKLLPEIRKLLKDLGLRLNEKKTILQRCDKGVAFTGYIIKPWGIYNGKALQNSIDLIKSTKDPLLYFRRVNSYLGFMRQTLSYGVRRKIIEITKQKFPWLFRFSYKGCWNIKRIK